MDIEDKLDWELVGLWLGICATFLLGLFNLLWGGGILSRRDKVKIREPIIETHLVMYRKDKKPYLDFLSKFKLVRSKGKRDLYFESAYVQLNKVIISKLESFFVLPGCEIDGTIAYNGEELGWKKRVSLKANEPVEFEITGEFIIQDSLLKILEEEDRERNATRSPEIMDNLERLQSKFKILWRDGSGKEWQYRVPEKLWHKVLPDCLWWRIT